MQKSRGEPRSPPTKNIPPSLFLVGWPGPPPAYFARLLCYILYSNVSVYLTSKIWLVSKIVCSSHFAWNLSIQTFWKVSDKLRQSRFLNTLLEIQVEKSEFFIKKSIHFYSFKFFLTMWDASWKPSGLCGCPRRTLISFNRSHIWCREGSYDF